MNKAERYVQNFIKQCREMRLRRERVNELRRVVLECEQALKANNRRRARALFAKADKIRAKLEK